MASWSASNCLVLSFCLRPPSRASSIAFAMEVGMQISVIMAEGQVMRGIGMFGIGGAIGPGKAAKAGYQGSPGTITLSCHFLKHFETPVATASRCFAMFPVNDAHIGAFLIRLSSSGPSRQPGVPRAVTALILRSLNLACSFHMLCAKPTASIIVSWKSL